MEILKSKARDQIFVGYWWEGRTIREFVIIKVFYSMKNAGKYIVETRIKNGR